tara:strand:- start:4417 stop:6525 length:2109 start_codon:yes stop_codon:yes gene_type:complete
MTAASTGVTPTPTRVPQYEDRPGDEWMSYVPEAYGQLPDAIKRQRQREVSELESGIPEAIRQAAQPMSRRGLYGSGLQLEDIGQAALQRQIAIDKAKTLAEIDPLKAQIAMGDLAQQRGTQRAQESRRRYEKEESYSQQQKARDDLMKQAAGSGILSTLTGRNPISELLFGKQTSPLEQALLASVTGGKGLGTGTGASQQGGLVQKLATSLGLGKLFGLPDNLTIPDEWKESVIPSVAGSAPDDYSSLADKISGDLLEGDNMMGGMTAQDWQNEIGGMTPALESEMNFFGGDGEVLEPFGDTFDSASLGDSEVASQAARQPSLPFKNPLDDPNLTAMLGTDTSLDYSPTGFLPSEAEMLAGEGGSMYGGEGTNILGSLSSGAKEALQGISDVVPGNILDTGLALAISSALNPEGLKGVAKNPLSFIGPQIMSQSGAGPLAIGKALATQTLPTGKALSSALTGGAVGLPMAAIGAGIASRKKARAQAEAEEKKNRTGSARYNFVPGELWMAGNKRTSPVLEEANNNWRMTDQITGMDKIYSEDPRRSVITANSEKSMSERGQDFAREAGIDYTNPDPDIQNTSQKWLGKQQVYSELIPELKPIFMAGLKGQMPREQAEDKIAEISNRYFIDNPRIGEVYTINKSINDMKEMNRTESEWSMNKRIKELEFEREEMKELLPREWKTLAGFKPEIIEIDYIEDEQG